MGSACSAPPKDRYRCSGRRSGEEFLGNLDEKNRRRSTTITTGTSSSVAAGDEDGEHDDVDVKRIDVGHAQDQQELNNNREHSPQQSPLGDKKKGSSKKFTSVRETKRLSGYWNPLSPDNDVDELLNKNEKDSGGEHSPSPSPSLNTSHTLTSRGSNVCPGEFSGTQRPHGLPTPSLRTEFSSASNLRTPSDRSLLRYYSSNAHTPRAAQPTSNNGSAKKLNNTTTTPHNIGIAGSPGSSGRYPLAMETSILSLSDSSNNGANTTTTTNLGLSDQTVSGNEGSERSAPA